MQSLSKSELIERLRSARTIAVVGITDDPAKPSHYVSAYMQAAGYRIIPVNPKFALRGQPLLGEKCWSKLTDIPPSLGPVDIVNCFRRSEDIEPIALDALAIGAKGLWQQVGIHNEAATQKALAAGLWCVSDECLMVVHRRWIGLPQGHQSSRPSS